MTAGGYPYLTRSNEASSPGAIRRHAGAADLPVDEIIPVADTVIVRPDPVPAST